MVKSGFFNSVNDDKVYNADDISDFYLNLVTDGVLIESGDELKVEPDSGLRVKINPGWAYIKSKYLHNTDISYITLEAADNGFPRVDRIVLRLDQRENARYVRIDCKQGTPSEDPVSPALTREENGVWELSLAKILVGANSSTIFPSQVVDERANETVCGYALFKGRYSFTEEMRTSMNERVDLKVREAVAQMSIDDLEEKIDIAEANIKANTDAAEDAIMTKLGNPQTASLESQISSISGNISAAKTSIESNTDSARTYLYNAVNTAKNEILSEIESKNNAVKADLIAELDMKYYDMTNNLSQMKREILKAISTLSDEATGNGVTASHSILITNGFVSDSYGFRIPTEE